MHFEFTIPLEPVAKGRPKFTKSGHAYTPSKTRKAEQDLRYFLSKEFSRPPLEGALRVFARFTFVRPKSVSESKRPHMQVKPDLSNIWKTIEDAGNNLIWCDDSIIVSATVEKSYGPQASIYLHVAEVQ